MRKDIKKDIKKRCVAAAAAASVFCVGAMTCFAAPSLTAIREADGTTTIKVVTDTKDPNYLLYILEPNTARGEMVKPGGQLQGLYKLEQLKNGIAVNAEYDLYEYTFSTEGDASGKYCVVAVGKDLDSVDKESEAWFVVPEAADEEAALTAVTATPTESTLLAYQGKAWYVDFENEIYQSNKSEVLASFAEICENPECGGDVQQAFETACALTELKHASTSQVYEVLYAYEDAFGLTYCTEIQEKDDGFLKSFTDLRADGTTNPLRTAAELNSLLRNAEGLSSVNAAKRETVLDVIREFEDVFGLSETLTGVDDYVIAKDILATEGNEYTSIAQVVGAVETAVEPPIKKPRPNPGPGGGSYSSSIAVSGTDYTASANQEIMDTIAPADGEVSDFQDLQGAEWAEGYIEYMNWAGIMTGDGNGYFRPADPITREEFAKALLTALKITVDDSASEAPLTFSDVDADAWYYETIEIACQTGIVNGIDDVTFGVGRLITRQDAATMVTRARNAAQLAFRKMADTVGFADQTEIADYALPAVTELQKAGVLNGYEDGAFRPENSISRAETAKLLYGMLDGLGKL